MSLLDNPVFTDAEKAREWLEALLWPNGPACPHCGLVGCAYQFKGNAHRPGVYKCKGCDKQFTVTVGTIFERSHIPLNTWLLAFHLMAASKKGVSAHQLHRMLKLTYKSAWFMCHRIREAMKPPATRGQLGGSGKFVEVDETYIGRIPGLPVLQGGQHRMKVVSLVERGGAVRSFQVDKVDRKTITEIVSREASTESHLMTDQGPYYRHVGKEFASHEAVQHNIGEYVRGNVHSNTIENFFSVFKRGMRGVYQHCGEQHLPRYLAEFDFRYSNRKALGIEDDERTERALKGAPGKRLTYRRTRGAEETPSA
jgi:transposase-like protein